MTESFHWASQRLIHGSRFQAYAKLLKLRSGGQADRPEYSTAFLADDEPGDEESDAGEDTNDSVARAMLSDSREDRMKRAFLDRLAELVANAKGGPHVSATMMIEWPDRAVVLVAKKT